MIPENYPYNVGFEWGSPIRFHRISQVIEADKSAGHKISIDDMERLQSDVVSLPAQSLVALVRDAVPNTADPAVKLLLGWNCVVSVDSAPAALYELWLEELTTAVAHRAAPPELWSAMRGWPVDKLISALSHPSREIFGASPEAARNQLLLDSLKSAREKLVKLEGPDPAQWSWGRIHTIVFRHPLDQVPGAKSLFDLGPTPRPGDDYTINATGFRSGTYQQVAGASYREVFDLGDWDDSVGVNVPGQSGQPASPHYSDLLPLWSSGRYFPLLFSRDAVSSHSSVTLTLSPQ
jgi:penicillin amidase